MNKRGCYCDVERTDSTLWSPDDIPDGYCGICQVCERPGHTRHFPGSAPYTGSWCDFHYMATSIVHPLGTYGSMLYSTLILLVLWWLLGP